MSNEPTYRLDDNNFNITSNIFMKSPAYAFATSFAGKTLKEIADWYPKPINVQTVLDYLGQEHEFNIIENIIAYMNNPMLENDDIQAKLGLLDFCIYADWLSHRVCFMVYVGTDAWMLLNDDHKETRHKRISHSDYNIKDYIEYILSLEGGDKRYITPFEFKQFLDDSKYGDSSIIESLYEKPYSIDSLFLALFQHGKKYGYDFDRIIDNVLVRDESYGLHPAIANEYIKYHEFLDENCKGKDSILTVDNIFCNFFSRVSIKKLKIEEQQSQNNKSKNSQLNKSNANN